VANPSGAGPALARWLKRSLGKDLAATVPPERVADVRCVLTRIVDNRYRWGSCTPSESVTFNWRLIKAPMFVIDYLIVHELAHLIERNHSPEFWSIVRAKMPTMEKAKAWLREHRQMLEQEI